MKNKKTVIRVFDANYYYLGADINGTNYFLREAIWSCDWYWSGGCIVTFTNNKNPRLSKDIYSLEHFNTKFPSWTDFMKFFTTSPLTEERKWQIYELMSNFYTARRYADMLHYGGSHVTRSPARKAIQNNMEEYDRINKEVIPAIMAELYKILGGEE